MTECLNETMRDRLPELANGLLGASDATDVRAHVASCAACAAELAVLETTRLVLRANAPRVDLDALTRAVTAPKPALRVERGGATAPAAVPAVARRPAWRSRQFLAAAASLLIVASVAIPVLNGSRTGESAGSTPDSIIAEVSDTPSVVTAPSSFAVSEGLADLSDDDLSTLLAELEGVEANIAIEPASMRRPIVDTPEEGY